MQQIINTYTLIFGESKMLSDACRFEELEVPFGGVKPADRGPPAGRVSTEERIKLILQLQKSVYNKQYIFINIHIHMTHKFMYTYMHVYIHSHTCA